MIQGGKIVVSNQGASNGIIHVIDRVLTPAGGNIGDILKSDPDFSIFSQMIENSAMNFTNMTLFAPTDQAFEVMDRERLENLLSNEECVGVRYSALEMKTLRRANFDASYQYKSHGKIANNGCFESSCIADDTQLSNQVYREQYFVL